VVEGCDCVVGVGWRWVNAAIGSIVALVFALVGDGRRQCTIILQPCPLSVDVLSVSFGVLHDCLPSHQRFLFLLEPLYLLLDPN
jgi:hypothetical protein